MKKILGILILAVLLIFSAGCITEEDDKILGTWKSSGEITGFSYDTTMQFENDNTGTILHELEDGSRYTYPILWEKYWDTYRVEEAHFFTFHEDGTMTDPNGRRYSLEEGAEKFGGVWTSKDDTIVYSAFDDMYFVFFEDGTGITTYRVGETEISHACFWERWSENQIKYGELISYSVDEEGNLILNGKIYEPVIPNTTWKRVLESTGSTVYITFYTDGIVRVLRYDADGNYEAVYFYDERNAEGAGYTFKHTRNGIETIPVNVVSGELVGVTLSFYELTDEGKLVNTYDEKDELIKI